MKSCIGFVGILAIGNCNHITRSSIQQKTIQSITPGSRSHSHRSEYYKIGSNFNTNHIRDNCPAIHSLRGGARTTQLTLSTSATMASLLAGSIGGAIGVGISYVRSFLSKLIYSPRDEKYVLTFLFVLDDPPAIRYIINKSSSEHWKR